MPETSAIANAATCEPTRLDTSPDSHLEALYRAAIGPMRAGYYLPILTRFEAYGRAGPRWNWAACGITLNWMLFRGLWLPAVLYLSALAAAALGLAAGMALAAPPVAESVQWSLWAALLTMALLVPGFFGNAWLYRVYRQRLDKALASTHNLKDACMLLARQSSSRPRLMAIALANLVLASLLFVGSLTPDLHKRVWPRASGEIAGVAAPATEAAPDRDATAAPDRDATAAPDRDATAAAAPPVAPAAVPEPAPAATATAAASAPAQATAAEPQPPEPAPAERYLINVGLFAQQDNALRTHATLQQAGLPAISESVQTRNGLRTRVRVGPFATREQAAAAAGKVRALQLDAVVIRQ